MATVYTQGMLNALKTAYASGVMSLTYEGKETRYRSLAEMERAMNTMQRELDASTGVRKSRQVRMATSRGLHGRVDRDRE